MEKITERVVMRVAAPVLVRVYNARAIRQPRVVRCRIASRRSLFWRIRRCLAATAWERQVFRPWVDKACWGVVLLSACYFAPLLLSLVFR